MRCCTLQVTTGANALYIHQKTCAKAGKVVKIKQNKNKNKNKQNYNNLEHEWAAMDGPLRNIGRRIVIVTTEPVWVGVSAHAQPHTGTLAPTRPHLPTVVFLCRDLQKIPQKQRAVVACCGKACAVG